MHLNVLVGIAFPNGACRHQIQILTAGQIKIAIIVFFDNFAEQLDDAAQIVAVDGLDDELHLIAPVLHHSGIPCNGLLHYLGFIADKNHPVGRLGQAPTHILNGCLIKKLDVSHGCPFSITHGNPAGAYDAPAEDIYFTFTRVKASPSEAMVSSSPWKEI